MLTHPCIHNENTSAVRAPIEVTCGKNGKPYLDSFLDMHTKFGPDGGFGFIKGKLKTTKINCMEHTDLPTQETLEMESSTQKLGICHKK